MVKKQRKASPRNEQKWIFQGVLLKNVGPERYISLLIVQVISETAGSLGGRVVPGGGKFFRWQNKPPQIWSWRTEYSQLNCILGESPALTSLSCPPN